MLVKENVMMNIKLQALEKFKTAIENRTAYRSFSLDNTCEPKLNARKDKPVNIRIAGGIEVTY
jgi:hypothetical protein